MPIGFGVFQPIILSENNETVGYSGRTGRVAKADWSDGSGTESEKESATVRERDSDSER